MWIRIHFAARIVLSMAIAAALHPVNGADDKPDKRKSQAAYQRGVQADKAGHRDQAIGDYSEAIEADNANGAAWRARGKDYLTAGDKLKAAEDLEQAVRLSPADGEAYGARGELYAAIGQPERAIQDFT